MSLNMRKFIKFDLTTHMLPLVACVLGSLTHPLNPTTTFLPHTIKII